MNDLLRRYYALCDQRDATAKATAPLFAQAEEKAKQVEVLRAESQALVEQAWALRGGVEAWFRLKKEIAVIARAFGAIPPR